MYIILLAGGKSTRFNYFENKLNILYNSKKLIQILIEKILEMQNLEKIILVYNEDISYLFPHQEGKIIRVNGGDTRLYSLKNAYDKILEINKNNNNLDNLNNLNIIIHDGARSFINQEKFIKINDLLEKFNSAGYYKKCVSTIINKIDDFGNYSIPRDQYVESHTPQALKFKYLDNIFKNITDYEFENETEILNMSIKYNQDKPYLILGEDDILKITYLNDYLYLSNYDKINKKNVLITGMTGGIGSNIFKKLLLYNFNVYSSGRNEEKIKTIYNEIKIKENYLLCDFNSLESINNFIKEVKEKNITFDYIILSHGIIKFGLVEEFTPENIQEITNVNYLNNIIFMKGILPFLNKNAVVINISSSSIKGSRSIQQIYSSTKIAFHNFINGLALDYKDIYFYNLVPRRTSTESRLNSNLDDNENDMLKPQDISDNIINLIISANKNTSGNDIFLQ